ncbi:DNA/RNA nuclease SfsA [Niallia sp. Sow4_A1]|jgi:sugar fermentation stimulation protein A|uniref:Sugar fermentation stimulation protein homolog n=1 Tax=Niallia hominis TaxID=3133173 RepID=A0ABV1EZF7_9BACI|nr:MULTISPECIES: DNA/RNA nuclease SfsA [Bacillaceae]MCF2649528.1 DNA/RNA nuclease SfsA [Niallia circulans]MCM3361354.1 DNA/RNA nuclease SfsA [Niallia sp. MER TA 168]CAI9395702.1 Sugar fermentation stimulation protein A [Bacillus sp. T2.9-1]
MSERIVVGFPAELKKMTFVERPNRFILHCLNEETNQLERVHLADPGRLMELLIEGVTIYVLPSMNPNRKTKWTAVYVESNGILVSINTTYPNKLVESILKKAIIEELSVYRWVKSEYTYGSSRWDFLLEDGEKNQLLLEVKSVTLAKDGIGMFPDAITKRGSKHVQELTAIAKEGTFKTAILFVVQRGDVEIVTGAAEIDPVFAKNLEEAAKAGVQLLSYTCVLTEQGIGWGNAIPVDPFLKIK